jgi:hypothetical protein
LSPINSPFTHLSRDRGNKLFIELEHGEPCRVPDFIAEFTIPFHPVDIQVDITSCSTIRSG